MEVQNDVKTCVWISYDEDGKGYINYQDFLDKLGASEFAPADMMGTSADIIDNSHKTIMVHNEDQLAKHQRMTKHQAIKVAFMNAEQVERQLRYGILRQAQIENINLIQRMLQLSQSGT